MAAQLIVFDVNETLSDMAPIADRFADIGAPRQLAPLWFAGLLRDGFARTAAGASERFAVLADGALRTVLHGVNIDHDLGDAITHVLAGFAQLPVHPEVPAGIRALRAAGHRLVTLSNGAADVAQGLLERAGLRDEFDALLSVEHAGVWKPHPEAYACGWCRSTPSTSCGRRWNSSGPMSPSSMSGWPPVATLSCSSWFGMRARP